MDIYGERQVQADVRTEAKVKLWEWRQSIVREEEGKEVALAHSKSSTYESSSCRTFKTANMHLLVQSHELVHLSGLHCHMRASSTSGCTFVYVTSTA